MCPDNVLNNTFTTYLSGCPNPAISFSILNCLDDSHCESKVFHLANYFVEYKLRQLTERLYWIMYTACYYWEKSYILIINSLNNDPRATQIFLYFIHNFYWNKFWVFFPKKLKQIGRTHSFKVKTTF